MLRGRFDRDCRSFHICPVNVIMPTYRWCLSMSSYQLTGDVWHCGIYSMWNAPNAGNTRNGRVRQKWPRILIHPRSWRACIVLLRARRNRPTHRWTRLSSWIGAASSKNLWRWPRRLLCHQWAWWTDFVLSWRTSPGQTRIYWKGHNHVEMHEH